MGRRFHLVSPLSASDVEQGFRASRFGPEKSWAMRRKGLTMRSLVPPERVSLPLDWLAMPALGFSHPEEILSHRDLTDPERRAILASWASDARVVEGKPSLRGLENDATVPVSAVLSALRRLDGGGRPEISGPQLRQIAAPQRRSHALARG
jgi:hypothetical protein